jgi:ABC-type multidrug transport system permease subunit
MRQSAWYSLYHSNARLGGPLSPISLVIIFPLLMMGGSFFPLDVLPDWLAAIGRLSPNGYVVDQLTGELTSATAWTFDMRAWSTVGAMLLSGLMVSVWRLQTGFARK